MPKCRLTSPYWTSMDDKDRVFARFKDDTPEASDRRELLTIPRRAGASGSRTVEVVHVRSGGAVRDRPQRVDPHLRAASWDGGFPAKHSIAAPAVVETVTIEAASPTAHVMPAWERSAEAASAAPADEPLAAPRRGRGRPRKHPTLEQAGTEAAAAVDDKRIGEARASRGRPLNAAAAPARRVADPFDASDAGANCMRCGYAIAPGREKRGLMTCGACG